jgi:hypothetical protein
MSSLFSCFQSRKSDETEPLLPQYDDDTSRQRALHQKLHTYQMLRAMSKGYLPSTEQTAINLRTILASDVLNPNNPELSRSGQLLLRHTKRWVEQFIELLLHKNGKDEIQDFLWFLSKSRVSVDVGDIVSSASRVKDRANVSAAYESFRTAGSLLLTNSDFRIFVQDLGIIGRQIFADTAETAGEALKEVGKEIEPSQAEQDAVKAPGADDTNGITSKQLNQDAHDVAETLKDGAEQTGKEAYKSLLEHFSGDQRDTLLNRLKIAIVKLRKRRDYTDSVSTLTLLLKRYALVYSKAAEQTIETIQDDVEPNPALERAVKNLWSLVSSFGSSKEWERLEDLFNKVIGHAQRDPDFEQLVQELGKAAERMFTDPSFFENAGNEVSKLQEKAKHIGVDGALKEDVQAFIQQLHVTFESVLQDQDVSRLVNTSLKIFQILSPAGAITNQDLIEDFIQVIVPMLISAIQYIPVPRLEVSIPEIDLLMENLILEPGRTINHSSFFPYKLRVETYNDLEIRKAKFKTVSKATSLVTIKLDGMSLRADDLGFWFRAHSGLLRLADEGIASFELDERGIDIHVDFEIAKNSLENMLTLRDVRVKVHHLSYKLRKSKFAFLAWILKPLLRPILRKVMEAQLATALSELFHASNRELVYARERLRATRISDPDDVKTFIKAIITRLTPEEDPDLFTSFGPTPTKKSVFSGVYAPGSLVKVWNEEAVEAGETVDDNAEGGWRNAIFDTHVISMT